MQNKANLGPSMDQEALAELQNIILGLSTEELLQLQSRIKDKDYFAEDLSRILPLAVHKSVARSEELSDALLSVIENAIFNSVQKNPKALADALFPIMGPAIRQSISDTFRKMIQSLNETLKNQFSIERIKWRIEAFVNQKSYAEIVLLKGLNFKVISAMLIHKETGILIGDAHAVDEGFEEADMVSSMLTAIQDFIHDSFNSHLKDDDKLDTIRLNDFNVWVIDGPTSFLAIVFDGEAPESKREFFKEKLEGMHSSYGTLLKEFSGEEEAGEIIKPILKECIIDKRAKKDEGSNIRIIAAAVLVAVALIFWIGSSIVNNLHRNDFITELKQQESIIVLNHNVESSVLIVEAMKDVLSAGEYESIASTCGLDSNDVVVNYANYISTDPKYIKQRLSNHIGIPSTVKIIIDNECINVEGKAPEAWRNKALSFVSFSGLNSKFNFTKLKHSEEDSLLNINSRIEKIEVKFKTRESRLNANNKEQLDKLLSLVDAYNHFGHVDTLLFNVYLDNTDSHTDNMRFAIKRRNMILSYLANNNTSSVPVNCKIKQSDNEGTARIINFKIIAK